MNKTIVVSGYFIWLHVGHIEYFRRASKLGELVVVINNDEQQILKYGEVIVPLEERIKVIESIECIDKVIASIDKDKTVCETLQMLQPLVFANGGDRIEKNIPEAKICKELNIEMIFGLGNKIQSSSDLLKKWKHIKS